MEHLTCVMVLHPGAPKVPGNAHLQEELVKNQGLGLNIEAKGICVCRCSHHDSASAPPPLPVHQIFSSEKTGSCAVLAQRNPSLHFTKTSSVL